jgi:hypothetical protein
MKKKEKKRKRSAEKNVDEREAPRAQTYQKQDLRVFLPQPQGGENVVEPIERPDHFDDSLILFGREFFIKRRDNSKIKKRMLQQHARQKKLKQKRVKKKKNFLSSFSRIRQTHRKHTTTAKRAGQKKQISDVIYEGKRILMGGAFFGAKFLRRQGCHCVAGNDKEKRKSGRAENSRIIRRRIVRGGGERSLSVSDDDDGKTVKREKKKKKKIKCVIIPGFLRGHESYREMREHVETVLKEFRNSLEEESNLDVLDVSVAKIERDWWIPVTFRGESLRKILDAIEDAVAFRPAKESDDDDDEEETRIILIGHSAGGWIARLFLGGKSIKYDGKLYEGYKAKTVAALVTLGTPHNSAEAYPFGRVKEVRTREKSSINGGDDDEETSLQETRRLYPNCFHSGMKYVTVQGTGFKGRPFKFTDFIPSISNTTTTKTTDWKTLFEEIKHGISYKTDCQDASADGDSVTCVSSGLGLGPEAIEVAIEGVKHEKDDIYPWYGSLDVVRTWMRPVLEMLF